MAETADIKYVSLLVGDPKNAVWLIQEVALVIDRESNLKIAAAVLLEAGAADAARVAVIQANDQYKTDLTKIPGLMLDSAKRLRDQAIVAPLLNSGPEQFSIGDPDQGTVGSMDVW